MAVGGVDVAAHLPYFGGLGFYLPYPLPFMHQMATMLAMTATVVNTHANIFKKKTACLLRSFAKGRRNNGVLYVSSMGLFFPQWFFVGLV